MQTKNRRYSTLLAAGFGALLCMTVAMIITTLHYMQTTQQQFDRVVSENIAKVGLSLQMRTAARTRTLSLLRLIHIQDPFARDEEWMQFNQMAANFVTARNTILAMPLATEELQLLELQAEMSKIAVPIQNEVVALINDGELDTASWILNEKAVPAQDQVIAVVDSFDAYQRDAANSAYQSTNTTLHQLRNVVIILGTIVVVIGILIALFVIRLVRQWGKHDAYLATHDTLTGLPNRALLIDRLQHTLINSQRHNSTIGVMFIDVDRFKLINDTYGHKVGDMALLTIRDRIAEQIRNNDTLARLSGDEFVVLLDTIESYKDSELIAQRIVQAFTKNAQLNGNEISLAVSIGIAIAPDHGTTDDALISHSDSAMYQAKKQGRNCWAMYQPAM